MFYAVVVVVRVEDDDADNFDKAWEKVSSPFAPDGDIMFVGEPWKVTSLNGDDDPEFGTFEAFVEHPGNPWMVPFDDLQSSVRLAMESAGIDEGRVDEVVDAVRDYAVNHHGDDGLAQDEKFLRKFGPDTGN